MKRIRTTDDSLPKVEEFDCGENEELERYFGVRLSQYGMCPHCKQLSHHLDYWAFIEKWKTIHLGFVCDCGARWEENYKIEPLPIDMNVNRF